MRKCPSRIAQGRCFGEFDVAATTRGTPRELAVTISPRVRALFWISTALLVWTQAALRARAGRCCGA